MNKDSYDLLPSPIRRVFYLSSEGSGQEHEVAPKVRREAERQGAPRSRHGIPLHQHMPHHLSTSLVLPPPPNTHPRVQVNPRAVQELDKADAIIYGMGSLYTSICPIICLDGMGEVIATRDVPKVRVLVM